MTHLVRSWVRWHLEQMVRQFLTHDCLARAGTLTYTTLFAIVPVMTVAFAIFSVFPEFEELEGTIETFIFSNFVPNSSALVQEKLAEFSARARNLTGIGVVFLFVSAFFMLVTIEKAFNTIWHVTEPRHGVQRLLQYWAVLSLGPALILVGAFLSAYLWSLPLISDLDAFGLKEYLIRGLPFLLNAAAFTVLYYAVPNCPVPLRHAFIGGAVTSVIFELAKFLFSRGLANASIEPIYGTFAAFPMFLLWLYMVWVVVLCGAIFVRTLSLNTSAQVQSMEPVLVKCARVVKLLYDAHMTGKGLTDTQIEDQVAMTPQEHERVFGALSDLNLLGQTESDGWILRRNLKSLSMWDLYQKLPEGLDTSSLSQVKDMDEFVQPLRSLVEFGSNQMSVSLDSVFGGVG